MQLFIINWKKEQSTYIIDDLSSIHQITRVLRMRPGDFFVVQPIWQMIRYEVSIASITATTIVTSIITEIHGYSSNEHITLAVAMPNKFEKAELIVQKATEVGVDEIIFRPWRRSIIREFPEKKMMRCVIIAKEATEQAWWWHIPTINWSKTIPEATDYTEQFLVDYHDKSVFQTVHAWKQLSMSWNKRIAYIWPEWWFHEDEYSFFAQLPMKQLVLWNQVLRMETAAITTWWWLSTLRTETRSIWDVIVK
jgi:16S rRNA (uracil1498-N3)-methyltransferase